MDFVRKHATLLFAAGIIILFFFTRLYNLLGLPVFTDEAIYIRWSQYFLSDVKFWDYSMTDGKQPMYVWIAMPLMKLIQDPLFAGRMVSVLAGFFSTVGIFFLVREIFTSRKLGLAASLIYVIYPFAVVYDRMALYDSLVAMFIVWSLYVEILLVRYLRLSHALILGVIIGAGMLTKTNANFALILLPFSLLLFHFKPAKNLVSLLKSNKEKLLRWVVLALVAAFIANVIYASLRLSPFFHIIADKNLVFIYSFQDWIQRPFAFFAGNIRPMFDWINIYVTVPFVLLVAVAFLTGKKYLKEKVLLLVWFIVPFLALAFFGKNIYPRFIFFMTMPLLVLGTYGFYHLQSFTKNVWLKALVFAAFFAMYMINSFYIITDFSKASVPRLDNDQFYAGWPSGVGVRETVAFLEEKAKHQKIYVGTEGTFGLMPYALEIYLHDNPNITVKGFWPVNDTAPDEALDAAEKMPTYFVFYQHCPSCPNVGEAPPAWPLKQVFQIKKEQDRRYYTLYQFENK